MDVLRFFSPVCGTAAPLSQCEDPCFAQGRMGRGVLLLPATHTLYSPADAQVYFSFSTRHALGLQTPQGVQFILHVGLDTHKLQGEGFQLHVAAGDYVRAGDPLLTFDAALMAQHGFSTVTPFVFCNLEKRRLSVVKLGPISTGDELLRVQ